MPTTIVNYNKDIINFLEDVNYGLSKPQFNHLATMIEGIINIDSKWSISKIAEHITLSKDKSCICRFLSESPWDDELLNRNRISLLNYHIDHQIKPGTIGFLVIDDTTNIKDIRTKNMEGLDFHYSHSEGKNCWSHCVVTSNFVAGPYSIPMHYKPYYPKEKCLEIKVPFKSKVDIAREFIEGFKAPRNLKQLYVLMDSWYTSNSLVEAALSKGYHLIGGIKSNRTISPSGIKLKISQFTEYIGPNTLDVVTVKGKEYRVYRYEGKVGKFDNAILLISYEVKKEGFESPVFILCTDIDLETQTILEYYSVRWSIEISYQYFKENLGFDQYHVRRRISIERYFLLCFLAYNFLEIFRITQANLNLETIGQTIRHYKDVAQKDLVDFIYYQGRNNVPLENVYQRLNLAA